VFEQAKHNLITVRDWVRYAVSRFHEAGLYFGHGNTNAYDEAVYLILHTLHLPPDHLEPFLDARLLPFEADKLVGVLDRRIRERLPAAYITREAWLQGFRFYVDERVIVPRSYLGFLILERFHPWLPRPEGVARVLDLCTGSGCLAILLAQAFPDTQIDAVDISPDALDVARKNVADYGLEERIRLVRSDLFQGLGGEVYDLIVANPPYVDAAAMTALPREFRREPRLALTGGEDGLEAVRTILAEAPGHLSPDGWLAVELGHHRTALETEYPNLEFLWPDLEGGEEEVVFLISRKELVL
jgi:ribosomal protein L3 glutamine methyltransferase